MLAPPYTSGNSIFPVFSSCLKSRYSISVLYCQTFVSSCSRLAYNFELWKGLLRVEAQQWRPGIWGRHTGQLPGSCTAAGRKRAGTGSGRATVFYRSVKRREPKSYWQKARKVKPSRAFTVFSGNRTICVEPKWILLLKPCPAFHSSKPSQSFGDQAASFPSSWHLHSNPPAWPPCPAACAR